MKIKVESPTIWGYDQDDIKCARKLMEYGITSRELKDHIRDWRWVADKVVEDNKMVMDFAWTQLQERLNESRH